jgi:hypothetical protein
VAMEWPHPDGPRRHGVSCPDGGAVPRTAAASRAALNPKKGIT